MSRKRKGWRKEPVRHGLAAQGVKTTAKGRVRDIREEISRQTDEYTDIKPPREFRNPTNIDEIIELFRWCTRVDDYSWFKFDEYIEKVEEEKEDFEGETDKLDDFILKLETVEGSKKVHSDAVAKARKGYREIDGETFRVKRIEKGHWEVYDEDEKEYLGSVTAITKWSNDLGRSHKLERYSGNPADGLSSTRRKKEKAVKDIVDAHNRDW